MAKDFMQEDLVWAKMKGYPPWPAKIASPPDGKIPKAKKPQHYVFFFGTHDHAWIADENIDPHSELKLESARAYKKKSSTMVLAIEEIEEAQKTVKKTSSKDKESKDKEPIAIPTPSSPALPPEVPKSAEKPKKKLVPKKRDSVKAGEKKTPKRTPKKRSASEARLNASKGEDSDADFRFLKANVPPNNRHLESAGDVGAVMNGAGFDGSATTSVVLSQTSAERIKGGILSPSDKKIGFLGLGAMGTAMVEQLLATKHDVTVWNRTQHRVQALVEAGAKTAETPADVVQACDITLCCLNGEAVEEVVCGRNGVLEGLDGGGKAYVEMSSILPAVSQKLSEAVCGRGGKYLEAPLVGERRGVADRSLVVVCAGDRGTFLDCDTLFATWSTAAFYVGPDAGYAGKIALLVKMLSGVSCAALSESMGMLQRCGVRPQLLMEVLGSGPCDFPLLMRNGAAMAEGDDSPVVRTPVKHAQRDMAMAVKLGDSAQQPLQLAAVATDAYVRAAARDPDADVATIHQNTYIDPNRLTTTEMWTKLT